MEDPASGVLDSSKSGLYRTGFHIFLSLIGAIRWKGHMNCLEIRKAKFDDVVATGIQNNHRCVVARKICIGDVVNVKGGEL